MENIKQLLEQLGFKDDNGVYLPMLSEFLEHQLKRVTFDADKNYQLHKENEMFKDFITQPLTKGMFLPCAEEGNIIDKNKIIPKDSPEHKQYKQALERVLFDGWFQKKEDFSPCNEVIQDGKQMLWYDKTQGCKFSDGISGIGTIEQAVNNGVKLYLK